MLNRGSTVRVRAMGGLLRKNNVSQTACYGQVPLSWCKIHDLFFHNSGCFLRTRSRSVAKTLVYSLTFWNQFSHHDAVDVEKTINMPLTFYFDILVFFILGDSGVLDSTDCTLVSTSYWNIKVSSQVMMFSSSSNLSRTSEENC